MGVLEELLRQLQEAAEQGQRTTLPGTSNPAPVAQPVEQRPTQQRQTVQQQQQAKQQQAKQRQKAAASPQDTRPAHPPHPEDNMGEDPVHRLVADSAPAMVARRIEYPLFARLREPKGLRDAMILSEILRRPARRPGRS